MKKNISAKYLTQKVHNEIKITQQMGIKVVKITETSTIIKASLKPNLNHKMTAFGGSVHSAALIGCWALLNYYLPQKKISPDNLVGQDSSVKFLLPVNKDFKVVSQWLDSVDRKHFVKSLTSHNKGRCVLISKVYVGKKLCAEVESRFVVKT